MIHPSGPWFIKEVSGGYGNPPDFGIFYNDKQIMNKTGYSEWPVRICKVYGWHASTANLISATPEALGVAKAAANLLKKEAGNPIFKELHDAVCKYADQTKSTYFADLKFIGDRK